MGGLQSELPHSEPLLLQASASAPEHPVPTSSHAARTAFRSWLRGRGDCSTFISHTVRQSLCLHKPPRGTAPPKAEPKPARFA